MMSTINYIKGLYFNPYKLNGILTKDEYKAFGFTEQELPLIRRHNKLHDQYIMNGFLKPRKKAEMFELVKRLGL